MATETTAALEGLRVKPERGLSAATLFWLVRLARHKPLGFGGLVILLVFGLSAAFAGIVAPYGALAPARTPCPDSISA